MNINSILLIRGPRQASPRRARTAAAIIATAGFALLAAACGSPASTGPGGAPNAAGTARSTAASVSPALAFTRCVRSHGVPDYPDPDSSGGIVKETPQQLGVSDSQYQAAQSACQHLLPNGGQPTNAQSQADLRNAVKFAGCMRSHGWPQWPDPVNDGGSLLHIDLGTIGMG